ncbi:uncharacterized protein FRV6_01324 [Fusarium oxysporum]|uniref:Uncharacterized protein n=2 Tax=Fusarium oxysporum TaxID=5507 RepID=A0A2H3SKV2_FUSOX|nr:uncharacterized protein FRV6_01324 [Fusarium oxysporum]
MGKNKKKNNKTKNGEQQGEGSKNATASQKGTPTTTEDVQAVPDMDCPPYSLSPPPNIPLAVQYHRNMVYHLLQANITLEDKERSVSDTFVTTRNASERAAMERIATFFDLNENIRAFIRKGVQSGHITEQDIESFVTEQIVPFEGPTSYAAFSQIQTYLAQCGVPFVHHRTSVSGGSAPGCSVRSYMAQKVPSEIIEVNESPNTMVDNPVHKSDKSVEEEVEVAESDQPEHFNPEATTSINANCSGYQAQKKVDDRSPVSDVASKEKVDEGDDHGSQTTEAPQLDDLDAQDTEPAVVGEDESCGNEPRSDTIGESDYDAYERKTLESCEAAVEQSNFHKQRAQEQLEHATSKISQCDEMAQHAAALRRLVKQRREMENQMDYHEREIEDLKVSIQEV